MGWGCFGQAEDGNEDSRQQKAETKSRVTVAWRQRSDERWGLGRLLGGAERWGRSRISGLQMEHEPPGGGGTLSSTSLPLTSQSLVLWLL